MVMILLQILLTIAKNNCPSSKASYFVDQVPKLPLHINVMSGTFNLAPTSNLFPLEGTCV